MEINTNRNAELTVEEGCDVELTVGDIATIFRDPKWGEIKGDISIQQDLQEEFALYRKQEEQTKIDSELSERINTNSTNIESVVTGLHTEVDRAVGAEKDLEDKKVDKTSDANKLYGTDAEGAQTTYNALEFGKVDDVRYNSNSLVTNKIANLDGFLTYDDGELD